MWINPSVYSTQKDKTCPVLVKQIVEVNANVNLHPYAQVGDIQTRCIGQPRVVQRGWGWPCHKHPDDHTMMIRQLVCISIPIQWGMSASVEESSIHCESNGSSNNQGT